MDAMQDFLSKIGEGLRSLAGSVEALSKQIETLTKSQAEAPKAKKPRARKAKPVKKAKPPTTKPRRVKKKPAKKKAAPPAEKPKKSTATVAVLEIIKGSDDGVSTTTLKEKTGFNDKKIANTIYRLKKQGAIKSTGRGVYTSP